MRELDRIGLVVGRELRAERRQPDGIVAAVTFITVLVLGVIALPPVVVVNVVLALRLRARAALVPILALPVLVPQLVAASRGASAAISGDAVGALSWAGLLFAFAVVYSVLGLTIVPAAIE